jgi:hypothetical protein
MFEKLIYTRMNKHIISNKVLVDEQYGEAAIYQLTNNILKSLDNKE